MVEVMITSVTSVMAYKPDENDNKIIKIIKEEKFVTHDKLKKLVIKKEIISANTFEKRIRILCDTKIIHYIPLRFRSPTNSRVPNYTKFYTMKKNMYPPEFRMYLNRESLKNIDQYIVDLKEKYHKLPVNKKIELATSYIISTWGVIFDIIKYNIDTDPEKNLDGRLLATYKKKLREMYDIIRNNPHSEIVERYVNAKSRPFVNQFTFHDIDTYFELNTLRVPK
jgi:hypothetical protein